MGILLIVLLLGYCSAIALLARGLTRQWIACSSEAASTSPFHLPTVAIIIAVRNEAANLPRLIACLEAQDYPAEKLEICIIDDRSDDETWAILRAAACRMPNLIPLQITDTVPHFAPKKRALDRGIRATRGDILLFTDGDCSPPPRWVQTMVHHYGSASTIAVLGYSPYRFDAPIPPLLSGMLALEFFSIAAVAAGATGWQRPLTAAGCNLSYRRSTYYRAGGFDSISQWVSGDDDLFILKAAERKLGTFAYALHGDAFVPAAGPTSWKKFWHQRIRYASKGRHYSWPMSAGLITIYLMNALLFFGTLSLLIVPSNLAKVAAWGWLGKMLAEFLFLYRAATYFECKPLLKYYLPAAILHPVYILVFGFLGLFSRFDWKGDSFRKTHHEPEPLRHA